MLDPLKNMICSLNESIVAKSKCNFSSVFSQSSRVDGVLKTRLELCIFAIDDWKNEFE